jgi:LAO/AO transport system kinase
LNLSLDASMPSELDSWAAQVRAGDVRALSRAISAIENREQAAEELLERLSGATGNAYLVGVTGAPGTGKSTLVDRLTAYYRAQGQSVGILAVDPSSPYSGGAILGDRIRMQSHAGDAGVFIRSMATRGFLGGMTSTTADAALLLDAAGKQVVLIETVGVGQDEIDVVRLADCTVLVLVPGLGDEVQSMKAGIMEIADVFVINKAEREGAERLEQQIQAMMGLVSAGENENRAVVRTTATDGRGIEDLANAIGQFRATSANDKGRLAKRQELWKRQLTVLLGQQLAERAQSAPDGMRLLDSLAAEVADRKKTCHAAVRELLVMVGCG